MTTNSSNRPISIVLSQGSIGKDLPIANASRTLSKTEHTNSTIEKELFAIVYAVKYCQLKLEEYDYHIHYKNGKLNSNAGTLSRVKININKAKKLVEYIEKFNKAPCPNLPSTSQQ